MTNSNNNNNDNNSNELEYIKINQLLKLDRKEYKKYENINIYGVITYIGESKLTKSNTYSTPVTIIDDSCCVNDKLKCVTFNFSNDKSKTINSLCNIGDIIRFHRFKIQLFNDNIQGCAPFFSSWVAFDRIKDANNEYKTRTNKQTISSINDFDKKRVDELREWANTHLEEFLLRDSNYANNPASTTSVSTSNSTEDIVNHANDGHTTATTNNNTSPTLLQQLQHHQQQLLKQNQTPNKGFLYKSYLNQLITYSKIKQEGYFNIVCQLCAKCNYNNDKNCVFLLTWDATKTNLAVHSEIDYEIENETMLYVNDLTYYIQIYVFDEYIKQLDDLNVGDYLLIVNLRSTKPNRLNSDTVVKLPGNGGHLYGRTIIKLDDKSFVYSSLILQSIQRIEEKKNELNVKLIKSAEFKQIINAKSSCKRKSKENEIDDDDDDDDDDVEGGEKKDKNKANNNANGKKTNNDNNNNGCSNGENSETFALKPKRRLLIEIQKDNEEMYDKYDNICISQNKLTILEHRKMNKSILSATSTNMTTSTCITTKIQTTNNQNAENNEDSDSDGRINGNNNNRETIKISSEYVLFSKRLERLYKHIYLTPITIVDDNENMDLLNVSTFNDILSNNNENNSYKCKVIAKLFNFTTEKTLPISFIYVFCNQCNYINTLPYHFVNVFEPYIASKLYIIETDNNYEYDKGIDQDDYSANFNIKWLFDVKPSKYVKITSSNNRNDSSTSNNDCCRDEGCVSSFYYDCPRCYKLNKKKVYLQYTYRFPFKLIDSNKIELKPCLFEYKSAFKLVNYIDPLEYCCFKQKTKYVFDQIHKLITSKKMLFVIEVINNVKNKMPDKENILYKIIDFSLID